MIQNFLCRLQWELSDAWVQARIVLSEIYCMKSSGHVVPAALNSVSDLAVLGLTALHSFQYVLSMKELPSLYQEEDNSIITICFT